MTEVTQADIPPQTNGIDDGLDEDERSKIRPADIDADVREMERRKRVEHIMNSKMFREELERIIETQMTEGIGTSNLMQQISDMMGVNRQAGNVYKNSSCVVPINDIRGIEAMGYGKGEKLLRCKLAAVYRLIDLYGWSQGSSTLITARLNQDEEHFLVNPYGMLFHEITASSLIKVDMQANVIEQGTTNFGVNITAFSLHGAVHASRPDIKCIIHIHTPSVVAVSALKSGILPVSQESVVIGEVSSHSYFGGTLDPEEKDKLARNLGPVNKILLLTNYGALCCGETIEEAFFNARNTILACESQLKLLPVGLDNLVLLNEETRKRIYESAHRAPESSPRPEKAFSMEGKVERKWRVGGVEFEGLMRMLDNVGFRTGYIYRHPLVKGEPPRPKNDVELPPAVSSLGYLIEEEELYKKGLWRNLGGKGQNRSRWLNSPNVYQRVEILETGTQDPKKITKWVADGSPTHSSTPVKIESALQFVPKNTNPKEFKQRQQQIKDYRRADKISAGPQSYILDTLTWEEARKMQDASITQTGDQVVLMGAASKGIIQRGHQHNATVYKAPYAKNPFDSVTDEELDEYKKVVERKVKGEYDTDFSESESSAHINKRMDGLNLRSPTSETEEESRDEPRVLRIETTQAPKPSQPEVVLSDGCKAVTVQQTIKNYILQNSAYRTNSHAGFPKGSYIHPSPVHYHVVQQMQITVAMRPAFISHIPYNCSSDYLFAHHFGSDSQNVTRRSRVIVNINDAHSVSLDMSMSTLRAFIVPFANALNLTHVPSLHSQSCQTTYLNNFEYSTLENLKYTPLNNQNQGSDDERDAINSYERRIIQRMESKLITVLDNTGNDTFSDQSSNHNASFDFIQFDENDYMHSNESLSDSTLLDQGNISIGNLSSEENNPTCKCLFVSKDCEVDKVIFETSVFDPTLQDLDNELTQKNNIHNTGGSTNETLLNWDLKHLTNLSINPDDIFEEYSKLKETKHFNVRGTVHSDNENDDDLDLQIIKSGRSNGVDQLNTKTVGILKHVRFDEDSTKPSTTNVYKKGDNSTCIKKNELNKKQEEDSKLIKEHVSSSLLKLVFATDKCSDSITNMNDNINLIREVIFDVKRILEHMPFNSVDDEEIIANVTNTSLDDSKNTCEEHSKSKNRVDSVNFQEKIFDPQSDDIINGDKCNEITVSLKDIVTADLCKIVDYGEKIDEIFVQPDMLNETFTLNPTEGEKDGNLNTTFSIPDFVGNLESVNIRNQLEKICGMETGKKDLGSCDEGIEDCNGLENVVIETLSTKIFEDDKVEKFSQAIFQYLAEQCFEIRELVLFPEILHNPNLNKLLAKLKCIYEEVYDYNLLDPAKNELRIAISVSVMKLLEIDENVNSSNDSNIVSDKIFSITEFVSDILDHFFNLVTNSRIFIVREDENGENFLDFTRPFRDANGGLLHSTPDSPSFDETSHINEKSVVKDVEDEFMIQKDFEFKTPKTVDSSLPLRHLSGKKEIVTSFQKDKSKKSGSETFWISCNAVSIVNDQYDTPSDVSRHRKIINVDDIPLRPPEDLINNSFRDLFPIPEEPRRNLFGPSYVEDDDDEVVVDKLTNDDITRTDQIDFLAGGDNLVSYIAIDKPEVNVVVCNEVQFFRTCTINSTAFVKEDSVVFTRKGLTCSPKSLEDDTFFYSARELNDDTYFSYDELEGDWMGYEHAKF